MHVPSGARPVRGESLSVRVGRGTGVAGSSDPTGRDGNMIVTLTTERVRRVNPGKMMPTNRVRSRVTAGSRRCRNAITPCPVRSATPCQVASCRDSGPPDYRPGAEADCTELDARFLALCPPAATQCAPESSARVAVPPSHDHPTPRKGHTRCRRPRRRRPECRLDLGRIRNDVSQHPGASRRSARRDGGRSASAIAAAVSGPLRPRRSVPGRSRPRTLRIRRATPA